jgi:hypothetical protein
MVALWFVKPLHAARPRIAGVALVIIAVFLLGRSCAIRS